MRIRPFEPSDAEALSRVYRQSVEVIGPRDYSPEQVRAWASSAPDAASIRERAADGRQIMVAVEDGDRPIAFGDLEADGHIDLFYCAPEAAGRGVASALYDALEAAAREAGLTRLRVEASETAKRLFLRKGFVVLGRNDLMIGPIPIHNYVMERSLGTGRRCR